MLLGIQRLSVEDFVQRLPGRIHTVLVPRVSLYFPDQGGTDSVPSSSYPVSSGLGAGVPDPQAVDGETAA